MKTYNTELMALATKMDDIRKKMCEYDTLFTYEDMRQYMFAFRNQLASLGILGTSAENPGLRYTERIAALHANGIRISDYFFMQLILSMSKTEFMQTSVNCCRRFLNYAAHSSNACLREIAEEYNRLQSQYDEIRTKYFTLEAEQNHLQAKFKNHMLLARQEYEQKMNAMLATTIAEFNRDNRTAFTISDIR